MAIYKTQALDTIFHALGDATRRGMLSMLAETPGLCASELAEPFDISQPTVSKHLRVLEESALVERIVDGRIHRFKVKHQTLALAETWLKRHAKFWAGSLSRLGKYSDSTAGSEDR